MIDERSLSEDPASARLVPVMAGGELVYLKVDLVDTTFHSGESNIAASPYGLEQIIPGLCAFAGELIRQIQEHDARKLTLEFGCNFGMESGRLVAILGKASVHSSIKVGLEWTREQA
ncbi:MAG: hypothetical protein HOV77_19645 [Hamadaea sp.]|uniref:CU044_2847 family protein n=1 Tax=Hamadaea sp. TaxID=2024425 RepID=UPI0017A86015|nr:CU044_2847 family protein [Hamadaea sp.]NUT21394.1 hypothetical protein [Hamadaea sp.]